MTKRRSDGTQTRRDSAREIVRRLPRRTLLRGLGGVAVGLPLLEAMGLPGEIIGSSRVSAQSATQPKRFVFSFGGVSAGADRGPPDMMLVPDTVGPNYDLKPALAPIGELDVRNDISVVTGLKIPWQTGTDPIPPGGKTVFYHYNTVGPQAAGTQAGEYPDDASERGSRRGQPKGPTCDQIVADAIGGNTRHRLLAYRVQPNSYVGSNGSIGGSSGRISARRRSDGTLEHVSPTVSPRLAYESLFSGFVPDDPMEAARIRFELRRRRSVLDLVRGNTERLMLRVGRADRQRLERHFDEIRALENRVAISEPEGVCALPPHPGEDPRIGNAIIEYQGEGLPYSTSEGYSNEDLRAETMVELIRMAFACDLSRVASFMLTEWKCYMNVFQISDGQFQGDMHEMTHRSNQPAVAAAVAWHVKQLARLVVAFRDTSLPDGTTLLDHSAAVLVLEGGLGYDPEGENERSSHSTENMVAFVGGRAGALRSGVHVAAPDRHPAQVVISTMVALGLPSRLGEVEGVIPDLLDA